MNCSSCAPGYEATSTSSAGNVTCFKPVFKPSKEWVANSSLLTLQGNCDSNGTATLLTGNTYTIPAPLLEPKELKFTGYAPPYTKIHYELDFSRGAEVDIGCGTMVVGDSTHDKPTPMSVFTHPNSMIEFMFQWPTGRKTGNYPMKCPRYHRFQVIRAGNFTFVRAACP